MAKRKWGKADWSGLKPTFKRACGIYVSENDIDEAVANIFAKAALFSGISVKILAKKNRKFFDKKAELFEFITFYPQNYPRLVMMKELLVVPVA